MRLSRESRKFPSLRPLAAFSLQSCSEKQDSPVQAIDWQTENFFGSCLALLLHLYPRKEVNMDKNKFKGNWHEFKGELKRKWGKLTDNDFLECEEQ